MNEFSYSGLPEEYRPTIGSVLNASKEKGTNRKANVDYYDLNELRSLLDTIITMTDQIRAESANMLQGYSLLVRPETRLAESQNSMVSEPHRGTVSFKQYQLIEPMKNRIATHIKGAYENNIRNPQGTNIFDVYSIASLINSEARRIESFLDKYLGDIDDSSEFRTIELFQDWAKKTLEHTGALRYFLEERDKGRNRLHKSELDKVDSKLAKQYQAIFQTKLNLINTQFSTTLQSLKKDFGYYSDVFYKSVLGPALSFRVNVIKDVEPDFSKVDAKSQLGREAFTASAAFNASYASALTDHLRRNQSYLMRIDKLFSYMQVRSGYCNFIQQLSEKGTSLEAAFVEEDSPILSEDLYYPENDTEIYRSSHFKLDDIEDPAVHPQYLLREGGSILGDVWVAEGVKIDGVQISTHSHKGSDVDGSEKISGEDIVEGTLYSELVSSENRGIQPDALRVKNQATNIKQGVIKIDTTFAWLADPTEKFELQIVPYEVASDLELDEIIFDDYEHEYSISGFTTEDSNYISFIDQANNKLQVLDVNGTIYTKEVGFYKNEIPGDHKFIMPISSNGEVWNSNVVEIGNSIFYINPDDGIHEFKPLTDADTVIYPNNIKHYPSEKHFHQSVNIAFNSKDKKLYWIDLDYVVSNEEAPDYDYLIENLGEFLQNFTYTLKSYNIVSKEVDTIRIYDRYKESLDTFSVYELPLWGAAVFETDIIFLIRDSEFLLKMNLETGMVDKITINDDNLNLRSLFVYQELLYGLDTETKKIVSLDIQEETVDVTYIDSAFDGYILSATTDMDNKIYVNVEIDGVTSIKKVEI